MRNGGDAVLDVVDEGPGVRPRIGAGSSIRSTRAAPPLGGRVKGSGLGLAIAREYALAHGGSIDVAGRDDGRRGARFRLWLPLVTRESAAGAGKGLPLLGGGK